MTFVLHKHGKHSYPRTPYSMLRWLMESSFVGFHTCSKILSLSCHPERVLGIMLALLCLFASRSAEPTERARNVAKSFAHCKSHMNECASFSKRALCDPHVFEEKKANKWCSNSDTIAHNPLQVCFINCFNFSLHMTFQVLKLQVPFGALTV